MKFWNKDRKNEYEDGFDFLDDKSKPIIFQFGNYVDIHDYMPTELIIKHATNEFERDITVFDIIAKVIGLEHYERSVYKSKKGKYYIRTKYGFQPMVSYNKSLKLREKNSIIRELNSDILNIENENKELKQTILELKEKLEEQDQQKSSLNDIEKLNTKLENIRNQMEKFRLMYIDKKEEAKSFKSNNQKLKRILKTIKKQFENLPDEI
ncbi:MAG: hypothetical protein DSY77_13925 [Bacteroidetes bacterium]|jgi:predicted RNase H-like nuclease (RuvC/YqgF family)|nr:MAG: hypothetical protein DSY77_13925 [Bacteroidota bacterium]